jgi:hypothetical protein
LCTAINFRHYPDGRILALGNFQKIQKRVDLADTLESTFLVAQLISNLRGDEWLNTFKYLSKTKYPLQRIVKTFFPNTITPEAKQILLDTVKKYNETYGFPLDKDGEPFIPPPQKSWIRKVISKWF